MGWEGIWERKYMKRARIHILFFVMAVGFTLAHPALAQHYGDGGDASQEHVSTLLAHRDIAGLRALGNGVMPVLVGMYRSSGEEQRARIANAFYALGFQSRVAKEALLRDVHTTNPRLRISVQYALGRVSSDDDVVDTLIQNMRSDTNAYFRDKAACALAYDQMHLTEEQKIDLYSDLIDSLDSPNLQVRRIAIKALKIHTGQTRGFKPAARPKARNAHIEEWRAWLEEYRSNL